MNLQSIANSVISAINPQIPCTLRISTGDQTLPDGTKMPTYALIPNLSCQIQPVSSTALRQIEGLNLTGNMKAFWITGYTSGIDRPARKGGDLINLPDGSVWLIAMVIEAWPDWTHAIATKQNGQ